MIAATSSVAQPQAAKTLPARTGQLAAGETAKRTEQQAAAAARLLIGWDAVSGPMLDAIRGARHVVNVEVFGLHANGSGKQISQLLREKVAQGVEVNLLVDAVGSLMVPGTPNYSNIMGLRKAGVNVVIAQRFATPAGARHIAHRKVVAVDGRTAFLGGMNFSSISDDWHDVMVQLSAADGARAAAEFVGRWSEAGGTVTQRHTTAVRDAAQAAQAAGSSAQTQLLVNAPHREQFDITNYYVDKIRSAQDRIWVASPGLTDADVVNELVAAAKRGVDVRLVTPGKSPLFVQITKWSARSQFQKLLAAGAKAYETPEVAHTKAMIVDDEVTVGSYNLTDRSAWHDHEMNIATTDPSFVSTVERLFASDMQRSYEVTGRERRGVMQRLSDLLINNIGFSY